tara:strand:+ start:1278 stop:1943 length:666 start_codon:yes stop_codon:yes gene_type:complete
MTKEYEVKIVNQDIKLLKKKIKKLGASLVHPTICMRRSIFYRSNDKKNGFVRVREESNKNVKITCKQFGKSKYATEHEISVSQNYEQTIEFLKQCGLIMKSQIETTREKWKHPKVNEIVFDTWPGIPEFMEVDCKTEKNLQYILKKLDIPHKNILYSGVDTLYKEYYGISKHQLNNKTPSLTYNNVNKELKIKKGKSMLNKIAKTYKNRKFCNRKTRKNKK